MILFIASLLIILLGLGALIKGKVGDEREEFSLRGIGAGVLVVGLIILAFDSYTVVPTRNLAVQTSFGKPVDTLGNGFHLVAPWSSTEEFDATVQTLKLTGDDKADQGDPLTVRLANSATATVEVTVQWQIDPDADIKPLYLDYRNFENIGTNVVRRQLSAALNATFEGYDPLASLKADKDKAISGATLADLAKTATERLAAALPPGVKVRSLLIPRIVFDDSIQAKINQFLAALAETQIAEQQKQTAIARKAANDQLAGSANTPGVLYQNCLDMVERLTRDGKTLPAAFTCGAGPVAVVPVK